MTDIRICPKCGSTEIEVAGVHGGELCRKCNLHIPSFPLIDTDEIKDFRKNLEGDKK